MGWLYPMAIQGTGTSEVEALSSYLLRTANAHATTAGTLLGLALARFPSPLLQSRTGFLKSNVSVFIRPNQTTAAVVGMVSQAMGCGTDVFEPTTFLCLLDGLHRGMQIYSSQLRWCPACFGELRSRDAPIYFKLKWQVLTEYVCDIHSVKLRDRCRACGATQDSYGTRRDIGLCVSCSAPLDAIEKNDLAAGCSTTDIRDLVDYVAVRGRVRFPVHGVGSVITDLHNEALKEGREERLYRLVPRETLFRFIHQRDPITLQSALRIASGLGVPLLDLLRGKLQGTNRDLLLERMALPLFFERPRRRREQLEPKQLLQKMREAAEIVAKHPEPSLRALSREVGVSIGALWYHLPERTRQFSDEYKKNRADRHKRKREEARDAVRKCVLEWPRSHARLPSGKALLRKLRAETGLPKNLLRDEICRTLAAQMMKRQSR